MQRTLLLASAALLAAAPALPAQTAPEAPAPTPPPAAANPTAETAPAPAAPADPARPNYYYPDARPKVPESLTLDQALKFALENNYDIRLARERLREQEGLIVEVRAQALPNVSASANYTRNDKAFDESGGSSGGGGGGGGDSPNYQDWQVGIFVRQILYGGGGVNAAIDAAKVAREAALLEIQAVINDVLLQVRTRYADVLLNRQRISVQEQSVKLLEEQLQTVRNRFEAGSVSQFEVLTAEVALANAQPELISARNAFRVAIDELRAALGYQNDFADDLTRVPEFTGELEFRPATYDLASALATAKARRPELLRLERIEQAREAGVTVARADYRPKLYVTGGYLAQKSRLSNRVRDSVDGWTAGVEGSWAIFDGARTRGRVAQARAQLNQARLSLADTTLQVEVEVRRALSELQEAAELVGSAGKVVGQAEEALRLADVRYRNGAATQLDVLQARQALTEASLNRLEANYRHTVALATVRRALAEADSFNVTP